MKRTALIILALALSAPAVLASSPIIRIEVKEYSNSEPTDVKLSIPASMLEAFRPAFEEAIADIDIDGQELDLRGIWQEVRAAGPNEYVTINDGRESLSVSTTETDLVIQVFEDGEVDANIRIPLEIGDLLLGGDTVDMDGLMDLLDSMRGLDLIRVDSNDADIRIWVE